MAIISEQNARNIRAVSSLGVSHNALESTISTNNAPTHVLIPFVYVNSLSEAGILSLSSILVLDKRIFSMVLLDFK